MIVVLVALGAAVGAPARYLTDRAVQSRHGSRFPWGTWCVNVIASLVLGVVGGAAGQLSAHVQAVLGIGFCGALSTFSTFSYETVQLARGRWRWTALANVVLTVLAAFGAAALGWLIGRSF